ncbi:MAG: flagellar biosynthetic protein FliO [Gammaproteobacteria bacterium]|nr:flagellar biosynthetic protein FliO [Gammaproteobacteria bacterium]
MSAAPIGGSELLSFAASLIVVIGVIVVLGWLYSRSKLFGGGNNDAINVIASRAVGSKERLMVVEVAGTQLLVGMTASNVNTLHVFDTPVVDSSDVAEVSGFAHRLKSALKEMKR